MKVKTLGECKKNNVIGGEKALTSIANSYDPGKANKAVKKNGFMCRTL
jgi:hypothetical protein